MQLSIVLSRIEAEETNGSEGRLQTAAGGGGGRGGDDKRWNVESWKRLDMAERKEREKSEAKQKAKGD